MKPHIARLCLKHLDEYAIQFKHYTMVAHDGTIQNFNGVLCDLAPVEVCDWGKGYFGRWSCNGMYHYLPWQVATWAGLPMAWMPRDENIHTLPQLRAWLEQQAKGVK